jgi:hypothetical protein
MVVSGEVMRDLADLWPSRKDYITGIRHFLEFHTSHNNDSTITFFNCKSDLSDCRNTIHTSPKKGVLLKGRKSQD